MGQQLISRALAAVDPAVCVACEWLSDPKTNLTRTAYTHISAALIALGIAGYATNPSIQGMVLPLSLGAIWLGAILSPHSKPPLVTAVCVAIITISAVIAIPLAQHLAPTIVLAYLTVVLVPLLFTRNKFIFVYFTPVWVIHAALCSWQWFVSDLSRVTGITGNANSAAALLLIGCVYLINGQSKARWIMVPIVIAILFTGSRWTVGVSTVIFLGLFLSRYANWRYIAVGIGVSAVVIISTDWQDIRHSWIRASTLEEHLTGGGRTGTATETANLSFIPQGLTDNGIHSVPWRMMNETGILSGVAWIVASIYGLKNWRHRDSQWWMLLTVILISAMYYHAWLGPLAPFFWLLVRPSVGNRNPYQTLPGPSMPSQP